MSSVLIKTRIKKTFNRFLISLLTVIVLACDDNTKEEARFLEGHEIPNTSVFYPLGCCGISDRNPAVSPDDQWIAYGFSDTLSSAQGLYIMNLNTYEKTLLVNNPSARLPDWSPDGEWISFNIDAQIYKIKANGDSLTQLTFEGSNFFPDWSPDGKMIAYSKSMTDNFGLSGTWIMNEDGTNKRWIGIGVEPDWHPIDNLIISWQAPSIWHIFIVHDLNKGTSDSLDVIKNQANQNPQYSPDGNRVVFYNPKGIWIMNSDGTNPKRIIPNELFNGESFLGIDSLKLGVRLPTWDNTGQNIIYEHIKIVRAQRSIDPLFEAIYSFYRVNVDSALAVSNL